MSRRWLYIHYVRLTYALCVYVEHNIHMYVLQGWTSLKASFKKLPLRRTRATKGVLSDVFDGKYVQRHFELGFDATDDGTGR